MKSDIAQLIFKKKARTMGECEELAEAIIALVKLDEELSAWGRASDEVTDPVFRGDKEDPVDLKDLEENGFNEAEDDN